MNSEILANILITAFEGGSNYWLESATTPFVDKIDERPWYADENLLRFPEFSFTLTNDEGDEFKVDKDAIRKGWDELCRVYPKRAARVTLNDGSADAEDADVLLQLIAFGEVVYG